MPGYLIYARKSTEAEDRQVLSIESQITEMKNLALRYGVSIIEVLTEARSAKAPGRPVFNLMMSRIKKGEAQGIICWKLDRLARNPVDAGSIMWAMKEHGIKIITPSQTYSHAEENTILMYLEFGVAHKYIDDLSKNVKRGFKTKVEQGWYPSVAPLGYLNNPAKAKGEKDIIPDPERFPLIRKMWDLMLTGNYSPPKICEIANNEWGFKTRLMKKLGGKPLSRAGIYRIFTAPFYYGYFEYPRGSGHWYKGAHKPIITEEEYDRVQVLLGRKGNPRAQRKSFSFTGLIRCGECGAAITAEEKYQIICSLCRCKFSYRNRDACPRCETSIDKITHPTRLHYIYYHCTKMKDPNCTQRSVEIKELEGQIDSYLSKIEIPEKFKDWAIKHLQELHDNEIEESKSISESQQKAYEDCLKRLDNLIRLKTSPQNADGSLLSDEEYSRQRLELLKEKAQLEGLFTNPALEADKCLELSEKIFEFACYARHWFRNGDNQTKREVLSAIYSNLTLKDKNLLILAKEPFRILEEYIPGLSIKNPSFEPENLLLGKTKTEAFSSVCLTSRGGRDDIRTCKKGIALVKNIWKFFKSSKEFWMIPPLKSYLVESQNRPPKFPAYSYSTGQFKNGQGEV